MPAGRIGWCGGCRVASGLALLLAAALAGCGGRGTDASTSSLTVYAASALKAPLTEYGSPKVQKQAALNAPKRGYSDPKGGKATFTFGSTTALVARIRKGAAPDLLIGTAPLLDALYTAGYIEEPIRFTTTKVDAIVIAKRPRASHIKTLSDIERHGVRLAIAAPASPLGRATSTALGLLPASQRGAVLANVRVQAPTPAAIVAAILQGRVDAGLLYDSRAQATCCKDLSKALYEAGLPTRIQAPPITYSIAMVNGTEHSEQAEAFMFGLINGNEAGAAALLRNGLRAPPPITHRPRKPPVITAKGV